MSVQSEIDRLNAIKERIRTNLVAQGVTVPSDTMLDEMAAQILSVAGERGTGILKVTTAPSSYTTAIGDYTPKYRIALSTVLAQSGASEVLLGDIIQYNYYQYLVNYLDSSYAYISATRVSIRGATGAAGEKGDTGETGAQGPAGADGYTPVKGTDYWTDEDKQEMVDELSAQTAPVSYQAQTLTDNQKAQARANIGAISRDDLSTDKLLILGILQSAVYTSDQSAKIAMLKQNFENVATITCGVKNILTNVVTNNSAKSAIYGNAYIATLSALDDYASYSVTVVMDGVDITSTVYDGNGNISISAVTGDIVITAIATKTNYIEKLIAGAIGYDDTSNTIWYYGQDNTVRATAIPLGWYLTKGAKYRFSLNDLNASHYYGIQVMKAEASGLTWSVAEGVSEFGIGGCSARVLDSGWLNEDCTYEATENNLVLFINFKKADNSAFFDYETILKNFTITVEV